MRLERKRRLKSARGPTKIPDMNPKAIALPFLCAVSSAWAAVPADFAQVRAASGPDRRAPALAEIRLDAAVLAVTRTGFPDLRVFDGDFREVPILVEPLVEPRERNARQPVAAHLGEIRELAGNRFEIRCDLELGAPAANAVEIRTPLRDFVRVVRVVGSADGQFWQPLAEGTIYDYARLLDFRRTVVPLADVARVSGIVDKGIFIKERETALLEGRIDVRCTASRTCPASWPPVSRWPPCCPAPP